MKEKKEKEEAKKQSICNAPLEASVANTPEKLASRQKKSDYENESQSVQQIGERLGSSACSAFDHNSVKGPPTIKLSNATATPVERQPTREDGQNVAGRASSIATGAISNSRQIVI